MKIRTVTKNQTFLVVTSAIAHSADNLFSYSQNNYSLDIFSFATINRLIKGMMGVAKHRVGTGRVFNLD